MEFKPTALRHVHWCGVGRPRTSAPGKAEETRQAIIERALAMACAKGLGALTLGTVADRMRMSKTGVFARVGSIEALQLSVLDAYRMRFHKHVVTPARAAPAGIARLRAMFGYWARHVGAEGCLYLICASELGGRTGALRDAVLTDVLAWRADIEQCAREAVDSGHLCRRVDPADLACAMTGLVLALQHDVRLLGAGHAAARCARAFESLLAGVELAAPAAGAVRPPRAHAPASREGPAVVASLIGR